jgi:ArsR family transcriptional regulator
MQHFVINTEKIEDFSEVLLAVSHHLRLKIIKLIHEKKEVNVNVIYKALQIEQSITSAHLRILRGVDAVIARRDGKKIYYSLNYGRLDAMQRGIELFDKTYSEKPKKSKK